MHACTSLELSVKRGMTCGEHKHASSSNMRGGSESLTLAQGVQAEAKLGPCAEVQACAEAGIPQRRTVL